MFLLSLIAFTPLRPVSAQAQDDGKFDPHAFLRDFDGIEQKRKAAALKRAQDRIDTLQEAARSPSRAVKLLQEAVEQMDFKGADGATKQFDDWKKKNEDVLSNRAFQKAVMLHVFYIGLSVQLLEDDNPREVGPQLDAYVEELITFIGEEEGSLPAGALANAIWLDDEALFRSPITRWLEVETQLRKLCAGNRWHAKPCDLGGILNKSVIGPLRAAGDPRALQKWDRLMEVSSSRAAAHRLESAQEKFGHETRPEMEWERAQILRDVGRPKAAGEAMLKVLTENPTHPKANQWMQDLRHFAQSLSEAGK